jgi:hypothetical protein
MGKGGAIMADMRLIDAEWLKRVIRQHIKEHPGYPIYEKVMVLVCEALDDSPTVDAAPVVRCKDCAKHFPFSCVKYGLCHEHGKVTDGADFCSSGERRCDNG